MIHRTSGLFLCPSALLLFFSTTWHHPGQQGHSRSLRLVPPSLICPGFLHDTCADFHPLNLILTVKISANTARGGFGFQAFEIPTYRQLTHLPWMASGHPWTLPIINRTCRANVESDATNPCLDLNLGAFCYPNSNRSDPGHRCPATPNPMCLLSCLLCFISSSWEMNAMCSVLPLCW